MMCLVMLYFVGTAIIMVMGVKEKPYTYFVAIFLVYGLLVGLLFLVILLSRYI